MNRKKGFTLVELLAVVTILGVIATIATPIVKNYINDSKTDSAEASLKSVERAANLYFTNNNVKNQMVIDLTSNQLQMKNNKVKKGYVIGTRKNFKIYLYKDGYCMFKEGKTTTIEKKKLDDCNFEIGGSYKLSTTNKIAKTETIKGYKIYGNTVNNMSLGETNKSIILKLSGKNILDKSQFIHEPLRNETALTIWASETLSNAWIINNLKPSTTYTVSFNTKCTAVPTGVSQASGSYGFYLYSGIDNSLYPGAWFNSTGKYFTLNEEATSTRTITTPANLHVQGANYRVLVYTNRYIDNASKGYYSSIIYKNIQIEEGSTATAYEPYLTPQEYTITLNEPLRKVGTAVDYIDSSISQIVRNVGVNADGTLYALDKPTYEYISLPSITNLNGTTVVSSSDGNIEASDIKVMLKK